jgi:hypothetical protein
MNHILFDFPFESMYAGRVHNVLTAQLMHQFLHEKRTMMAVVEHPDTQDIVLGPVFRQMA